MERALRYAGGVWRETAAQKQQGLNDFNLLSSVLPGKRRSSAAYPVYLFIVEPQGEALPGNAISGTLSGGYRTTGLAAEFVIRHCAERTLPEWSKRPD